MLYMTIFTWKPQKRDEVIKRRAEKGYIASEGMKVIGEWVDIAGGRVFRLTESDGNNPAIGMKASLAWNDLGKVELIPVMDSNEVMKIISGK